MSRPPAALHGLARQVAVLEAYHGPPPPPPVTDPFEVVLWENCAYLVDDARRTEVFGARDAASLAADGGLARLRQMIRETPDKARRVLKEFRGIGEPGADHILQLSHAMIALAPESNGLRVLLRLGYGSERGDYAAQYRSVAKAVSAELKSEWRWLEKARSLLRTHGQAVCRRAAPQCAECPLTQSCRWFLSRRRPG